jgi:hypothetical protein
MDKLRATTSLDHVPPELAFIFGRFLRWLRLRRAMQWAGFGLVFGLAMAFSFSLVAIFQARLLRNELLLITTAVGLSCAFLAACVGLLWPIPLLKTANYFDRVFNLHERLSTSIELAYDKLNKSIPTELVQRQLEDTLSAARGVEPRACLPLRIDRLQLLITALLVASITLLSLRGDDLFQAALQHRATQQAISQQIEQIETLETQIEADGNLTPEEKQELLQPLDNALKELKKADTAEQAVSILTSAEENLQALSNPQAQEQSQGLQEVGKELGQQEGSPLQSFGENMAQEDFLNAAQDLSNIDTSNLSPEEANNLVDQLEEAAQSLASTNPELAEQLSQAAEALKNNDAQAAQQALQQAAQTLTQTGQQIAQSEAASQIASQLAQGQQQIIQAGKNASQQGSQDGQSGLAQGQGQGQRSNGGSSNQSNQGLGGGGAGRGEGQNDAGQGPEAGTTPIEQGNGPGDAGERAYEQIYAPTRLGGQSGDQVTLPGSGEPGDLLLGQGNTTPGDPGQSNVPYIQVYSYYSDFYRQAIESGQVPVAFQELIRLYFSSLAP